LTCDLLRCIFVCLVAVIVTNEFGVVIANFHGRKPLVKSLRPMQHIYIYTLSGQTIASAMQLGVFSPIWRCAVVHCSKYIYSSSDLIRIYLCWVFPLVWPFMALTCWLLSRLGRWGLLLLRRLVVSVVNGDGVIVLIVPFANG